LGLKRERKRKHIIYFRKEERRSNLDDKDVSVSNVFVDLDVALAIVKAIDLDISKRNSNVLGDLLGKLAVGVAAENAHSVVHPPASLLCFF
jgi:hypothetical protein